MNECIAIDDLPTADPTCNAIIEQTTETVAKPVLSYCPTLLGAVCRLAFLREYGGLTARFENGFCPIAMNKPSEYYEL